MQCFLKSDLQMAHVKQSDTRLNHPSLVSGVRHVLSSWSLRRYQQKARHSLVDG